MASFQTILVLTVKVCIVLKIATIFHVHCAREIYFRVTESYENISKVNCSNDEYSCERGTKCIPSRWRCNGLFECGDYVDEKGCESCKPNTLKCNKSDECVPLSLTCNGKKDCSDGSDENSCDSCYDGAFFCNLSRSCIPGSNRCDGYINCGDGDTSDEENCEHCLTNQFQCKTTNTCLSLNDRCNGNWDCGNGDKSDEESCVICPPFSFECNITRQCLPLEFMCDGKSDCGTGDTSDEFNCDPCPEKYFQLWLQNKNRCIPEVVRCNGIWDAFSHKQNCDSCSNIAFHCNSTNSCIFLFQLNVGECPNDFELLHEAHTTIIQETFQCKTTLLFLPKYLRCNGVSDCGINDASDEENCDECISAVQFHHLFHCKESRKCIPLFRTCDKIFDCGNNDFSDEQNCGVDANLTRFSTNLLFRTEVGSFSTTKNATNITYILQNSNGMKLEISSDKYELLVSKLENETITYHVDLEIRNATVDDNGNYTLQVLVVDKIGETKFFTFVFTVIVRNVFPEVPEFSFTNLQNNTIVFTPGKILKLICIVRNATGSGTAQHREIKWKWENLSMSDWHPALNYSFDQNFQTLSLKEVPIDKPGRFTCTAVNQVGVVSAYADIMIEPANGNLLQILGPIGVILSLIFLSFGLLLWYKYKQQQIRRKFFGLTETEFYKGGVENLNPNISVKEQANLLPFDKEKWEISRENIKLGVPLGSGAFGLVLKAKMLETDEFQDESFTTVAVKTVKTCADESQFKALIMELKVMANLGKHLNIVNLIGACTDQFTKTRELLIVMEFCKYGSLLSYLLDNRNSFVNQLDPETNKIDAKNCGARNEKHQTFVDQPGNQSSEPMQDSQELQLDYYKGDYQLQDVKSITTTDLLSWAFQIAKGMEYLSTIKILHGDLAARNVLLADNKIAKICDFGYARETFQNYAYQKDTQGQLLPIKWMAIESLYQGIFSSKSDCWSYGILLWELFTFGNKPYPGMQAGEEFCQRLSEGYRMEKPINAPTSVYQIMMECWNKEPNERPTFAQISSDLLKIMPDDEKNRLVEMIDVYTNMNEVDKNADYLSRMGEPTLHAVRPVQFESTNVVTSLSEHVTSSQYGPEPTCSISVLDNKERFATFSSELSDGNNF